MSRPTKTIDGVLHYQCASCLNYFPPTKKHFYFQVDRRKSEEPRPHSWCKPCYLTNTGRSKGMRVEVQSTQIPGEVIEAQRGFLALQSFAESPLVGAAA